MKPKIEDDVVHSRKNLGSETPPASELTRQKTGNAQEQAKQALIEIATHWAINYGHEHSNEPMYRGPYGIGVTDGHRACALIARRGLDLSENEAVPSGLEPEPSNEACANSLTPNPLEQRIRALEEALRNVFDMMDEGLLVRDISEDDKPDFAIRSLKFTQRLAKAYAALAPQDAQGK